MPAVPLNCWSGSGTSDPLGGQPPSPCAGDRENTRSSSVQKDIDEWQRTGMLIAAVRPGDDRHGTCVTTTIRHRFV
jgi:hypothetical protein